MDDPPCSDKEVIARVVALEANLRALRGVLDERDLRYAQRAASQDNAVKVALDTSKEAVSKAEASTERRLETLNELRGVVVDQSREFSRKAEVQLLFDAVEKRVSENARKLQDLEAHGGGFKDAIAYVIGAAGLIIAGLAVYFHR